MKKLTRKGKQIRRQKIAVGGAVAIVLGILLYFSFVAVTDQNLDEITAGVHYRELAEPRRIRGNKIEIIELFSYGCVHCFRFEPLLADWVRDNGDKIRFVRAPSMASRAWQPLARSYFTTEALGITEDVHMDLFRQIHNGGKIFSDKEEFADWFDGRGTTRAEYLKTWDSPQVQNLVRSGDRMQRRAQVSSVPTIIVHGKYVISPTAQVGTNRMLQVMDHLVASEIAERAADSADTAPNAGAPDDPAPSAAGE
jgi:thiol:disulfide interchange protein DsbA